MAMDLTDSAKQDLIELQRLQQQLQMYSIQRQQTEIQLSELDKTFEVLKKSGKKLYRFVGTVMVEKQKDELEKELMDEKETLELRKNAFAKQEDKLRQRFEELRKKFAEYMKQAGMGEGASLSG